MCLYLDYYTYAFKISGVIRGRSATLKYAPLYTGKTMQHATHSVYYFGKRNILNFVFLNIKSRKKARKNELMGRKPEGEFLELFSLSLLFRTNYIYQ